MWEGHSAKSCGHAARLSQPHKGRESAERRVREGASGRKGVLDSNDGSRSGLPLGEGKAVEPGQLDLDLSADRTEAGTRSIVALHARF